MSNAQYITLPAKAKNIAGKRFGQLVALGPVGKDSHGIIWRCRCDCGNESNVRGARLRAGESRSCGCLVGKNAVHGMAYTSIHRTWSCMKERCFNSKNKAYEDYGARGITVCAEWTEDFKEFYEHVSELVHYGEEGYTLDRIDNDGNYKPGNVRWATSVQQRRNQRRCRRITIGGVTRTAMEWSGISGVACSTICCRLDRGWLEHDAVFKPAKGARLITANGITRSLTEWARLTSMPEVTIHSRITRGWTEQDAVSESPRQRAQFAEMAGA